MNVLLLQLDGKLPNLALMRAAAYYRARGDTVVLRRAGNKTSVAPRFDDPRWDVVLGSAIFESTRPLAASARNLYPGIVLGGTGIRVDSSLKDVLGIPDGPVDYADYPTWRSSIGFTQRGCRLRCEFCVVPRKEGAVRPIATVDDIWRGEPWPREILLLDNDFFGQPEWADRIDELKSGKFKVSFSQGINARMLTDEAAAAIASVDYRDDGMKDKRIYTAWDNKKDERRLFAGLENLVRHGVKPREIMVYILIGFWKGETHGDRDYRRAKLREFGALPYPMPYVRTPELVGFQRWCISGRDKSIPWSDWVGAKYQPRDLPDDRQLGL